MLTWNKLFDGLREESCTFDSLAKLIRRHLKITCSYHSGQMCLAGSRVFLQEGIYDRFIQAFTAIAKSFKLGDGFDLGSNQGPLISETQLKVSWVTQ